MRIYAYCRVSTDMQANDGLSLESQEQQIRGYALMNGWKIAATFVERGVSGGVPLVDRPEGKRLMAALERGDAVVAARLDRCFRNADDALDTLKHLKAKGIGLHLIDLGGDITGNGIGKMVFTILAAVAENIREGIRERVREAKQFRRSQNLYLGGSAPFGYSVAGEGKERHLVPNGPEQRAIKVAKGLRAKDKSLRDIAAALKTEGLPVPDIKTISRILKK